jgi:chromosome partitioning protein
MLANKGRDVLLVDTDKQGSSTLFAAVREKNERKPGITCMSAFGEAVNAEIAKLTPKFDDIVIDSPGHDAVELRSAMVVADILVTPVEVSMFSTATMGEIEKAIRLSRVYNPGLRCILVPNRISTHVHRGAAQVERIRAAAAHFREYTLAESILRDRAAYSETVDFGRAIIEGGDRKAIDEMTAVFQEVCRAQEVCHV